MEAAASLGPRGTIRPLAYVSLFGLLAATGIRISEALALQLSDVVEDGLIINQTKFKKSRLVPLHSTARAAIDRYLSVRLKIFANVDALFISNTGAALCYDTVSALFRQMSRKIGLRGGPGQPGPRIHDLRHTFAVRSLESCPHDDDAVSCKIASNRGSDAISMTINHRFTRLSNGPARDRFSRGRTFDASRASAC